MQLSWSEACWSVDEKEVTTVGIVHLGWVLSNKMENFGAILYVLERLLVFAVCIDLIL